jgi:hypothetical protein
MRVANGVYVLPIPRTPQEPVSFLNITLIVDEQNGNTLVDLVFLIRRVREEAR